MKKAISILAVLLVATALFAGVTVKAGGTFAFTNTRNVKSTDDESPFYDGLFLKMSGFGLNIEVLEDVSNDIVAYSGVSMVFPKDAVFNNGSEEFSLSERIKRDIEDHNITSGEFSLFHYSVSAGVAYKLDFNALKMAVGAGLSYSRSIVTVETVTGLVKSEAKIDYFNIGLNAFLDARYMFTDAIGIGVTAVPQLGLFNISRIKAKSSSTATPLRDETVNGFKINFTIPVSVGVSYTF